MPSMPATSLSRSEMLARQRVKRWRWTSCADRSPRQSMSWNATCGARIARNYGAAHTSAAIWWRCARPRFPPPTPRQHGGRASETERAASALLRTDIRQGACCGKRPAGQIKPRRRFHQRPDGAAGAFHRDRGGSGCGSVDVAHPRSRGRERA